MANFLKTYGQPLVYQVIQPLIVGLSKIGVTPNMITTIGFLLNVVVAIIFIKGGTAPHLDLRYVGWGGFMILFAGLFDMIDGRLARVTNQSSTFGAFFDSVLDRYSELVMFLGICFYLISQGYFLSSLFAFIAMIGSVMVSYIRARAEGLGIECQDGLMQRPERIILIGGSAMICGLVQAYFGNFKYTLSDTDFPIWENITIFTFPLFLLAILANYTAWQRLEHCRKAMENGKND
jgi:CDP-diacylglycerol---glycerol-3-phosphate 3-phosphatidyltransferase